MSHPAAPAVPRVLLRRATNRWSQLRAKLHRTLHLPGETTTLLDYDRRPIWIGVSSEMEYHTRLHSCQKEPETVRWIEEGLSPGDVLYDIGANVGTYALVADAFWGDKIRIVAVEPSAANFARLNRNLALNRCAGRVIALPVALGDRTGILPFHCENLTAGGSLHALGEARDHRGRPFAPVATFPMLSYELDTLIERFGLPEPTHLKLDVDGTELAILQGSRRVLRRVRSVLVEVDDHRGDASAIQALLEESGLRLIGRFPYRYRDKFPQFDGISNLIFERAAVSFAMPEPAAAQAAPSQETPPRRDSFDALFEHVERLPKVLLVATGRTGSDFFQSLLDGHSEILQLTGILYLHQWWNEEAKCKNSLPDLVDEFIWHTCARCNHIAKFKSGYNKEERWDELGLRRNETFEVDTDRFKRAMVQALEGRELTCRNFFLAVHLAYGLATGMDIRRTKLLFYHPHHIERLARFRADFPEFDVIAMVRDPRNTLVSGVEHWRRYDPSTYDSQLFYLLLRRIFEEAEPVLQHTRRVKTLALEDLHLRSREVLQEFCETYGLELRDSLFESSCRGKKWWGDRLSVDYLDGFNPNIRQNKWKTKMFWHEKIVLEYLLQDRLRYYGYETGIRMDRACFPLVFFLAFLPMKYELDIAAYNFRGGKKTRDKIRALGEAALFYALRIALCIQFAWKRARKRVFLARRFGQGEDPPGGVSRSRAGTVFITGISASGKSTLGRQLKEDLAARGIKNVKLLDGEELRERLAGEGMRYGYSAEERKQAALKYARLADEYNRKGMICILCSICHLEEVRKQMRAIIGDVMEVYLDCPVSVCAGRDGKGHYSKAFQGLYDSFIGVTEPYQKSDSVECVLHTDNASIEECSRELLKAAESFLREGNRQSNSGVLITDLRHLARGAARGLPTPAEGGKSPWAYLGNDLRRRASAERILGRENRLEIGGRLTEAMTRLRQPFLDLVAAIGAEQTNTLGWWSSRLSWKMWTTSDLFLLICRLSVARDLAFQARAAGGSLVLVVEDRWLLRQMRAGSIWHLRGATGLAGEKIWLILRGLASRAGWLCRTLRDHIRQRLVWPQEGWEPPRRPAVALCSYPLQSSLREGGQWEDHHLPGLDRLLEEEGWQVVRFSPPDCPGLEKELAARASYFRPLILFATPRRIWRSLWTLWRPRWPASLQVGDLPVRWLLLREWWLDLGRSSSCGFRLFYETLDALLSRGDWGWVVNSYENQPWEKLSALAARRHGARACGIQTAILSPDYLPYMLGAGESRRMPLPDLILTSGPYAQKVLAEGGTPPERLRICGALRYPNLKSVPGTGHQPSANPSAVPGTGSSVRVLVVLPIYLPMCDDLLEAIRRAFPDGGAADGLTFRIRPHPLCPIPASRVPFPAQVTSSSFRDTTRALEKRGLILFAGSTVGFEALARGLPVLRYRPETTLDVDQDAYGGSVPSCGEGDLREKLLALARRDEDGAGRERALQLFSPLNIAVLRDVFRRGKMAGLEPAPLDDQLEPDTAGQRPGA